VAHINFHTRNGERKTGELLGCKREELRISIVELVIPGSITKASRVREVL